MSDVCIQRKGKTFGPVDPEGIPKSLKDKLVPCNPEKKEEEVKAEAEPQRQPKDEFVFDKPLRHGWITACGGGDPISFWIRTGVEF